MGTVSTTLPSDGQTIDASDVNTPINAILSEFNGNIDDNNIKTGANINGSKLLASSIPGNTLDTTLAGGWITGTLPAASGTITNNGNRSYDITFASTVASLLSPGMRLRTTRTVTAPTQCADLESGSSQYFNDTSVSGITFTDDFVCGAWVKLESYTASNIIISRFNGTSGWFAYINTSGQVVLQGNNAGGGNYSNVTSYQAVPLNKWTHIAVQLDMSAFTATTTTSYVMIDGVNVPSAVARAGTNPTALVQAGNLEVGAYNGGTAPFDGKLAQVFVSSAKITQANVQALMSQGLTTADTATYSLASAYSLSNSITDLNTTSANNLTAQGSAVATNADSPFGQDSNGVTAGTTDYALVMKVSTATATVQVPEGCTIPTSGGVSAVAYSTTTSPFGFTLDKGRWEVLQRSAYTAVQANPVSNTWYNLTSTTAVTGGHVLTIPVGAWRVDYRVVASSTTATVSTAVGAYTSLHTANNAEGIADWTIRSYMLPTGATANLSLCQHNASGDLNLSSATPYYLNTKVDASNQTNLQFYGTNSPTLIRAIPAGI